jgi:NAD+ kinase
MSKIYNTIALIGKPQHEGASSTIKALYQYLTDNDYNVILESSVAPSIAVENAKILPLTKIGELADLAIVVGGDGYMLGVITLALSA